MHSWTAQINVKSIPINVRKRETFDAPLFPSPSKDNIFLRMLAKWYTLFYSVRILWLITHLLKQFAICNFLAFSSFKFLFYAQIGTRIMRNPWQSLSDVYSMFYYMQYLNMQLTGAHGLLQLTNHTPGRLLKWCALEITPSTMHFIYLSQVYWVLSPKFFSTAYFIASPCSSLVMFIQGGDSNLKR